MPSSATTTTLEVPSTVPGRSSSRGWRLRWAFRGLFLALLAVNAWWLWGDWSPSAMKTIDALIAQGKLGDAEQALRYRLRWSPDDFESRMKLARMRIKQGDNLGCAQELHLIPVWSPSKIEAAFLEGQAFKKVNRAREAEAAWKFCTADDLLHPFPPDLFAGATKELVALYVLENRIDDARQVLWRAYDEAIPIDRPQVLATRLRAEVERIEHEEAKTKLRDYIAADPENWDARRALALEEHITREEAAADRDLEAYLKARPDDPLGWRALLDFLNDRGDIEAIRAAITRLPSAADNDPRIWLHRGNLHQFDGDPQGAFDAYQKAAKLAPNEADVLYKLGMAEKFLGKSAESEEHIRRSREIHQATGKLADAYISFTTQSVKVPRDQAAYRAAIEQIIALYRPLGWQREADAWQKELTPG